MRFGSLRSRLLLGAGLWTLGLLTIGVLATGAILLRDPHYPRVFHLRADAHASVLIVFAVVCLIAGLWQVTRGLSPIEQLRQRLSDVREQEIQIVDQRLNLARIHPVEAAAASLAHV